MKVFFCEQRHFARLPRSGQWSFERSCHNVCRNDRLLQYSCIWMVRCFTGSLLSNVAPWILHWSFDKFRCPGSISFVKYCVCIYFIYLFQDISIHNALAVFTCILIARHCFSLEDFVGRVALPSLLKVSYMIFMDTSRIFQWRKLFFISNLETDDIVILDILKIVF